MISVIEHPTLEIHHPKEIFTGERCTLLLSLGLFFSEEGFSITFCAQLGLQGEEVTRSIHAL